MGFEDLIAATRINRRIGREEHAYFGAVIGIARVAGYTDGAAVFVDDAAANPEAEASAILTFRGEKGLKQMWLHIFRNAGAVVCDRHSRARL